MKIFNKCLKKNINSNFILNSLKTNNQILCSLQYLSKTFGRNIGRGSLNIGEMDNNSNYENKNENAKLQSPPKIKYENILNDFEQSSSFFNNKNTDFTDDAFNREKDFKKKEKYDRDFKSDGFSRDFKNKRFDENRENNDNDFRDKRKFNRDFNFESKI